MSPSLVAASFLAQAFLALAPMLVVHAAIGGGDACAERARPTTGLVVHEWGTFTSLAGADGAALEWRPLDGPTDLPSFVYRALAADPIAAATPASVDDGGRPSRRANAGAPSKDDQLELKKRSPARVRMETPVLYFHSDRERVVDVEVGFPEGFVTEWYPRAELRGRGIRWSGVRIAPGVEPAFPTEPEPSHYYPARATEAAPLIVAGEEGEQRERFLFYRGIGDFDLPLTARLEGARLRLESRGALALGGAIVFENRAGRIGWTRIGALEGAVAIDRPDLVSDRGSAAAAIARDLRAAGLTDREVDAMIATWTDTWFEEGLRVFYLLPRERTDTILPLRIEPAPDRIVRVMVGRLEVPTPEREAELREAAYALASPSRAARVMAEATILRWGRFAEPMLLRLLEPTTPAPVRERVARVLRESGR